ncbi:MAG: isoprenylcysteine carboxylmethyltransferase family protein [Gemmatimonadetes bacterium]|nr:MAG: isoprenylcysteine carboxylmethyltransferase family protein [Gemmatimonadota bacterium]
MNRDEPDRPKILILPPVLFGGAMVIGALLHFLFWPISLLPLVPARTIGGLLFVAAGVLAHRAQRAMTRAGTNIFPTQPALALVTDGPFRFSRNPLYIASSGVYLAVAFWVDGVVLFLLFPLVFILLHYAIVLPEERYLETKFGETYRAYRQRVRRWL